MSCALTNRNHSGMFQLSLDRDREEPIPYVVGTSQDPKPSLQAELLFEYRRSGEYPRTRFSEAA